jgi:hypothetical protein
MARWSYHHLRSLGGASDCFDAQRLMWKVARRRGCC